LPLQLRALSRRRQSLLSSRRRRRCVLRRLLRLCLRLFRRHGHFLPRLVHAQAILLVIHEQPEISLRISRRHIVHRFQIPGKFSLAVLVVRFAFEKVQGNSAHYYISCLLKVCACIIECDKYYYEEKEEGKDLPIQRYDDSSSPKYRTILENRFRFFWVGGAHTPIPSPIFAHISVQSGKSKKEEQTKKTSERERERKRERRHTKHTRAGTQKTFQKVGEEKRTLREPSRYTSSAI